MNVKGTSKVYCLYCKKILSEPKEVELGYHLSCFDSIHSNKLPYETWEKEELLANFLGIPKSELSEFILNKKINYKVNENGEIVELELIELKVGFTLSTIWLQDLESLSIINELKWEPHHFDFAQGGWAVERGWDFEDISRLKKLKKLDLTGNFISIIPEIITNLTSLETLNLNYNAIKNFPENIDRLINLKKIFLNYEKGINSPTELTLPTNFGQLHQLEELKIYHSHMEKLPESFTNLKKLTTLVITGEALSFLYPSSDKNGKHLTHLPDDFENLSNLQYVDFSDNFITHLPDGFGNLSNLQHIDFSRNKLTFLPDSFGNLRELQTAIFTNNYLLTIPDSFNKLKHLETLNLSKQVQYYQKNTLKKFNTFPNVICELKSLKTLDLSNNFIKNLPDSFGNLTNLTTLDIGDNKLNFLPESLSHLKNLRTLSVIHNRLKSIPEGIGNLTNLRLLDLSANRQVQSVPDSFSKLIGLQELYLEGTGIVNLPSEIMELPNLTLGLTKNQAESFSNYTKNLPNIKIILYPNSYKWKFESYYRRGQHVNSRWL